MHLKIINVARSIKLPKHLELFTLWHQPLDINHIWAVAEHAGIVAAIKGEHAELLENASRKVTLKLSDIVKGHRLVNSVHVDLTGRVSHEQQLTIH